MNIESALAAGAPPPPGILGVVDDGLPAALFADLDDEDTDDETTLLIVADLEAWTIARGTDDAEYAMGRLREERIAIEAIEDQAEKWRRRIDMWVDDRRRTRVWWADYFTGKLGAWILGERARTNGRVKSVKLLSGTVKTTSSKAEIQIDDAKAIVEWAVENELDIVKRTPTVLVTTLREKCHVVEWAVIRDGELVDDVMIEHPGPCVFDPEGGVHAPGCGCLRTEPVVVAVDGEVLTDVSIERDVVVHTETNMIVPHASLRDEKISVSIVIA